MMMKVILLLPVLGLSYVCGLNVSPVGDQILPVNSLVNVSLTCNASQDANNSAQTQAIWEVEGRQIQLGTSRVRTAFANIGIFIEAAGEEGEDAEEAVGVVILIVSHQARLQYQDSGLMVRCTAFTAGEPPITLRGNAITIQTYGRPDTPGNLQLVAMKPTRLQWERPANIPTQVEVNYTIIIESPTTELEMIDHLSNQTQFSIERLEMELREDEMCHLFSFSVIAVVVDANNSFPAMVMDTVPLSSDVSSIEESLKVVSVLLSDDDVMVRVSFKAIQSCIGTFPVHNYTLIVNGSESLTITAVPDDAVVTGTLSSANTPVLVRDATFQVGVQACSDAVCRNSAITIPLNTSDVQTTQVIFFENNIFLSCSFANGSLARGCRFEFQVNLNETGEESFSVLQSERGQQCNSSANQRNSYDAISVLDLEADGTVGLFSLPVEPVVIESESEYVEMTGCRVQGGQSTNRAISIAVPIVVMLFLLVVLMLLIVAGIFYFRQRRKLAKPEFIETESPDTLLLEIKSDNKKILKKPPSTKPSALQSLPVTSKPMNIQPTGSLPGFSGEQVVPLSFFVPPERAAPIEVELGKDSVKVSLNKSALRAVARFHYMAKQHAEVSEGSMTSEEALSLLPTTNFSRVRVTDEFKSLCCDLPPLEEGGEEEKEMQSWCVINTPPPSPEAKQQDNTSL